MVSLDSSFLIDLLVGEPGAVTKARELDASGEPRRLSPPAAAEVLLGGYYLGGAYLTRTRILVDSFQALPFDPTAVHEAGKLGAELARRGIGMGQADLFIAAITRRHAERLLTRDTAFARVPGLVVEGY